MRFELNEPKNDVFARDCNPGDIIAQFGNHYLVIDDSSELKVDRDGWTPVLDLPSLQLNGIKDTSKVGIVYRLKVSV